MHDIPEISIDSSDVVVDEIRRRKPFLRASTWTVFWRSTLDADTRGVTVLTRDARSGVAAIGGKKFRFTVRWREDLRRRLLFQDDTGSGTVSDAVSDVVSDAVTEAVNIATCTAVSFAELTKDSTKTSY